jgi:hypothetical protein
MLLAPMKIDSDWGLLEWGALSGSIKEELFVASCFIASVALIALGGLESKSVRVLR